MDHVKRAVLINTAYIAGLHVLGLMKSSTAIAIIYAASCGFQNELLVLYDMGSSSYSAALVHITNTATLYSKSSSADSQKSINRSKTAGARPQTHVNKTSFDANLCGSTFNHVLHSIFST
jgi:molecular chaperone DnaK (HSP70)